MEYQHEATVVDGAALAPDWSALQTDINCPLCSYNLRGLVEPRCPECGYRFNWKEILQPERVHSFLFEHHPERNIWSFCRTAWAGRRPREFWRYLSASKELILPRLILYWLITVMIFAAGFTAFFCSESYVHFWSAWGVLSGTLRAWSRGPSYAVLNSNVLSTCAIVTLCRLLALARLRDPDDFPGFDAQGENPAPPRPSVRYLQL